MKRFKALIKDIAKRHAGLFSLVYYYTMNNRVRGKRYNLLHCKNSFFSGLRIVFTGRYNEIQIRGGKFIDLSINIHGDNNQIIIKEGASINSLTINIEDNNNKIVIGKDVKINGKTELAAIEGTTIILGDDCLLSANITVRTGDSHSITDLAGRRTNPSQSVSFGNHVWIGNSVLIFKGARVGSFSMIGGGSVVPGKDFPDHSLIAGNPAKIVKTDINWAYERLEL